MKHRRPRRRLGEVLQPGGRLAATGLVAGATVAGVVGSASFGSTAAAYSDSSKTQITSVEAGGDPVGTCLSVLGVPILCPIQLFGLFSAPPPGGDSLFPAPETTDGTTETFEPLPPGPAPAPEPEPTPEPEPMPPAPEPTPEPTPEPPPVPEPAPTEEPQP